MNEKEPINTPNETVETAEPLKADTQENINVNTSQGPVKNKKKKSWLAPVIAIVILIALVAGLALAYMIYTKPENVYKRLVSSIFDSYSAETEVLDFETYKGSVKLDLNVKTEEELIDEEILDLINDLEIEMGTQINKKDKQVVVNLSSDYDKEELINLQLFVDAQNQKTYLYAKEYIDKYLEVELEDEDTYSSLVEIFETEGLEQEEKDKLEIAMNIIKEEINKNLIKPEYCSAEKVTIKINDKDVNATKNTLEITAKECMKAFSISLDNLSKNEEFLAIFDEDEREDVKYSLEDAKEEIEYSMEDVEDVSMTINLYTTGLMQKIVKFEAVGTEEGKDVVSLGFTKLEEGKYSFEAIADGEKIFSGKFGIENKEENKGTFDFQLKIKDMGSLRLNVEFEQEINSKIEQIDEDKTTSIDELTEQEQMDIMEKLQDSKLYELIEDFSSYVPTEDDYYTDDYYTEDYYTDDDFSITIDSDDDSEDTATVEETYSVGQSVQLVDGSNWYVVSQNGSNITLLSAQNYGEQTYFSNSNNYYEESIVKGIVENQFLPALKTSISSNGGDITNLSARIISVDEIKNILNLSPSVENKGIEIDSSYRWLFETGSYWTSSHSTASTNISVYVVESWGASAQINEDIAGLGLTSGNQFNVRPVVETTIENIK